MPCCHRLAGHLSGVGPNLTCEWSITSPAERDQLETYLKASSAFVLRAQEAEGQGGASQPAPEIAELTPAPRTRLSGAGTEHPPPVRPSEGTHPAAPRQVTGRRQPAPLAPPRLRGAGRLGCGEARVPLAVSLWEGGGEQNLSQGSGNGTFAAANGYKVAAERPVCTSVSRAAESVRLLLPPPSLRRQQPPACLRLRSRASSLRAPAGEKKAGGAAPGPSPSDTRRRGRIKAEQGQQRLWAGGHVGIRPAASEGALQKTSLQWNSTGSGFHEGLGAKQMAEEAPQGPITIVSEHFTIFKLGDGFGARPSNFTYS
ncbi:uncharacterized protein LOC120403389 [Mauremys reevesii]|uniref:uncharacterized protein LOC120403389 n=1 Tax=Mauremys reevesii TaxID=260615 RepID=UPI00193FC890|nr:uncharacterized protein LOC120403389 [Mauremys reevesii]